MRIRNRKTYINYVPEGNPPDSLKKKFLIYIYFLFILVLLVYILFFLYKKIFYVEVSGYLEVPKIVICPEREGIVKRFFVKENNLVKKNDPLVLISAFHKNSFSPIVFFKFENELKKKREEIDKLKEDLKILDYGNWTSKAIVIPELIGIENNIRLINLSIKEKEYKLLKIKQYITDLKNNKYILLEVSKLDTKTLLNSISEIERLKYEIKYLKEKIRILKTQKQEIILARRREILLKLKRLEKEEESLKLALNNFKNPVIIENIEKKSPINGKILKIFKKKGDLVLPEEPIMVIVPEQHKVYVSVICSPKKLKYFGKSRNVILKFPDGTKLKGKILESYSVALSYRKKLVNKYFYIPSPIKIKILLDDRQSIFWEKFDGIKVKVRLKK